MNDDKPPDNNDDPDHIHICRRGTPKDENERPPKKKKGEPISWRSLIQDPNPN